MPLQVVWNDVADELETGHARGGYGGARRGRTVKGVLRRRYRRTWPVIRAWMRFEDKGDAWHDDESNSLASIRSDLRLLPGEIVNREIKKAIGEQGVPLTSFIQDCATLDPEDALALANAQLAADPVPLQAARAAVRAAVEAREPVVRLNRAFDAVEEAIEKGSMVEAIEDIDHFDKMHEDDDDVPEWALFWPQAKNAAWDKMLSLTGQGLSGIGPHLNLLDNVWDSVFP